MCGFAGYLASQQFKAYEEDGVLRIMARHLKQRGPDAEGFWKDSLAGVGLCHARLAVVELSPAGGQPMLSHSQRWVLVFNGEIYNHLDLRARLLKDGHAVSWRGTSDTETLVAGFDAWGIQKTLQLAVGMFSLAVWDNSLKQLTLARDRIGEKPLYYGWQGKGDDAVFLFGSDLAALRCHPSFSADINRDALGLYLRLNSFGGEYSVYKNINKLLPGNILTVSSSLRDAKSQAYWSSVEVAQYGGKNPFSGSSQELINELHFYLKQAVVRQMISDVPLGAFLSGGIDSSTIVALMQAQSSTPVKTFTIGFHEQGYDEAQYARKVANHLGTSHTEVYVSPQEAQAVIPNLPDLFSEPFADSSQIPMFLISRLARQQVTVALSGDGGDELFGGYNRYAVTARLWKGLARIPEPIRHALAQIISVIPQSSLDKFARFLPYARVGEKLHKGASVLASDSFSTLYRNLCSLWPDTTLLLVEGQEPKDFISRHDLALSGLPNITRMMNLDLLTYLPDDILVKVDRAAMGVSLETRVPMLDHELVEFASRIPLDYKLRGGIGKWALREVLYQYVPKSFMERPKMGFTIPLGAWLRGPLRGWVEELISENRIRHDGYFKPEPIRQRWKEHLTGNRDWAYSLWSVLMFQAWLDRQKR